MVGERDPALARRLVTVADVEGAAPEERRRFYEAAPVRADDPEADEIVRRLAEHGADTSGLDRAAAFAEVCRATIRPGEVLVAQGSPPAFVYVPTGAGPRRAAGRRLRPVAAATVGARRDDRRDPPRGAQQRDRRRARRST